MCSGHWAVKITLFEYEFGIFLITHLLNITICSGVLITFIEIITNYEENYFKYVAVLRLVGMLGITM